ncbi:MAG: hypothetical protein K9N38_12055 [Candidatus Marinimicrobia bacterium]|nr:hypothetical protein [Candidatus Neomarinimicrobiota bacterium]MCF7851572.1 hypothetical protein [Candidatus Neomarinimicrobiota bacterium]
MLRYLAPLTISAFVIMGCAQKDEHAGHDHASMEMSKETKMTDQATEKVIYYTCPMDAHKHIHAREPGNCSECGMTMVAGVVTTEDQMEYWGCPMEAHAHVRLDSAGTCEECGMQLKPMRLKKI